MKPHPSQNSHLPALAATGLLDTPPEAIFDRLTEVVTKVLRVPVSTLTLIDEHRQFFKSACGMPEPLATERETPISHSFCKHVAYENESVVAGDAREHHLLKDNPSVQSFGVRAYAGMPVRDPGGTAIGALCAISFETREWTQDELDTLRLLADQASAEIAVRSATLRLGLDLAHLQAAEERRHQMVRLDRHDLRTPLNAMLLSVSAVPHLGPVNDAQQECIATARRNCDAVLGILDRMLDIGNIDHLGAGALSLADCHPAELISRAIEQVAALAESRHIRLQIEEAPTLPTIPADGEKITRVLVNLLANAVKFTADHGHISISAKARNNDGHPGMIFSVKDDGIGIAAANLERIFNESFRVDKNSPTQKSTGLGLTFCQRVVEAHGGRIWVESELAQGSCFSFFLPSA